MRAATAHVTSGGERVQELGDEIEGEDDEDDDDQAWWQDVADSAPALI
jgi:hypothetical protein